MLWDCTPNDIRDSIELYHYGSNDSLNNAVERIIRCTETIMMKLRGVNTTPITKRWAKGMLAYWSTVLESIDQFRNERNYAAIKLRFQSRT